MSNFIEQIITMLEERTHDALVLQPKPPGSNGCLNIHKAKAIIRYIRTNNGVSLAFHTLQSFGGKVVTGSGSYGELSTIIDEVLKQFGVISDDHEWIGIDYCDPEFPIHLIP